MEQSYEKLVVWQKAIELVTEVYEATRKFPKDETFGLRAQVRRAAVSVPSNIAEGRGRQSQRDFRHFLGTARGSLLEAETQMRIARNLKYLEDSQFAHFMQSSTEVGRLLNGLLARLKDYA